MNSATILQLTVRVLGKYKVYVPVSIYVCVCLMSGSDITQLRY